MSGTTSKRDRDKLRKITQQLHDSILHEEGEFYLDEEAEMNYVPSEWKTPAMLKWERQFNERIDVALNTSPVVCKWYPRLCYRLSVARCFYHRYGQIDPRLVVAWKVMLGMVKANKKVENTLTHFKMLMHGANLSNQKRVPTILTLKDIRIVIQALSMVPEDMEIEG